MDFRKEFLVEPGSKVRLSKVDPAYKAKHLTEAQALAETQKYCHRLSKQQYLMYSEKKHSLLIVLQAPDAGGKEAIRKQYHQAAKEQSGKKTGDKTRGKAAE